MVVYNIPREAPRTLYSLSAAYQRHIAADAYEVIVVDNGSTPPLDRAVLDRLAGNFRLLRVDEAPSSPAKAINLGLGAARGETIGVMIDGARLVTPGLLHFAHHGARMFPRAVVATLGWHLGFDSSQALAIEGGYDQRREDSLLAAINWPDDGYRLFEIAALDGSSVHGWLSSINESNALFLSRAMWEELEGVDERFAAPGGGLLNLDTFGRAVALPDSHLVVLLGEATFHQVHAGIATNADLATFRRRITQWVEQYEALRGRPWAPPRLPEPRTFLGTLPRPALAHFVRSALDPVPSAFGAEPPLGSSFDRHLWSLSAVDRPASPVIRQLLDLAHKEFRRGHGAAAAAVARLARAHAADEVAPQRLLAHASAWSVDGEPPPDQRAAVHAARGDAYRLLGDNERAEAEYRAALSVGRDEGAAHLGLARAKMPGDDYRVWLERLHEALRPETYVEIGLCAGSTLALARPPTRVFGVDPEPSVVFPLRTETHLFTETSDTFFAERRLETLLAGRPVTLAFIQGLQAFEPCLRAFMNLEAWCAPTSVILLHDVMPIDEPSQRRTCETPFGTGDVWKALLALRHYRPTLDIVTVPAAPSGLTLVTGLEPSSRILAEVYDEAVRRFIDLPFADVEDGFDEVCHVISNDWDAVAARLRARAIL